MRIGYSFWNYISDIEKDSPSGGNLYIPDLVLEMKKRKYKVIALQENRDEIKAKSLGIKELPIDKNFLYQARKECYEYLKFDSGFPEIDLLLIEWRWPIPGRNTLEDINKPGFTNDLIRQNQLLEYYYNKVPIIIWDQDHKITIEDEKKYSNVHIIEPAINPNHQYILRTRVNFPFNVDHLWDIPFTIKDPNFLVCYIGNNYERDRAIDTYIKPLSEIFPYKINFIGNWLKYPDLFVEIKKRWPYINYFNKIAKDEFIHYYGKSYTCPLLAKDSYYKSGFMTYRIIEALYFKTFPVGFQEHTGINNYLTPKLIVKDAFQYKDLLLRFLEMSQKDYKNLFEEQMIYMNVFDPRIFVNTIEDLASKRNKLYANI